MATTLEKYAGARQGNYCTLPKLDVEILPDVFHCKHCDGQIKYRGTWPDSKWVHITPLAEEHKPEPRLRCMYCHTDSPEHVSYKRYAWHDATECTRCGGVNGYAIGD
jgi:Zn finger protein HypA/HybF involved in hydrogenase expression